MSDDKVNNGHSHVGDNYITDYDPLFRQLLRKALGFDPLDAENYDVKMTKIVLDGSQDKRAGDVDPEVKCGAHLGASFHLIHLNLIVRMDLFDST